MQLYADWNAPDLLDNVLPSCLRGECTIGAEDYILGGPGSEDSGNDSDNAEEDDSGAEELLVPSEVIIVLAELIMSFHEGSKLRSVQFSIAIGV